ncbi:HET-domain-containing protein [Cadophora sp. DSE1049]|nr:HET-domain-containing protein [Cadophora sp. DSE1049]
MDTPPCPACRSSGDDVLPSPDYSRALGQGLEISIDDLLSTAASGCQPCFVLLGALRTFQKLSPDFETSYPDRYVKSLFVRRSYTGTLLVTFDCSGTYVDHLELFAEIGSQPPWTGLTCGVEVPENITLESATVKVKNWISLCDQHSDCPKFPSYEADLPTRVLSIGGDMVCLQETAGKTGIYATLSHCWGTSQPITTSRATLQERYNGISWSSLPRVFKDAISLTRNLGIEYLWIDSLCIIQGDELDWIRESSNMVAIYSDSYLNIAATSSPGSDGSLFGTRWTTPIAYETDPEDLPKRPVKSYTIPLTSSSSTFKARYSLRPAHEHVKRLHHSREGKRSDVYQKGPLLTRSWAFQERILSPRTIHFHTSEMVWECNETFDCECGDLLKSDPGVYGGDLIVGKRWRYELETGPDEGDPTDAYTPLNRWLDGVELYSRLRITDITDRLPALAGLATRFSGRIHSQYLAGHWESDLPRSLCWKVVGEQREGPETSTCMTFGKRCVPYCVPSWSWASVDLSSTGIATSFEARITFEHLIMTDFVADERFELINVQCTTDPLSPFGKVTSGSLKFRAPVLRTGLYIDNADFDPDYYIEFPNRLQLADLDFSHEHLEFRKSKGSFKSFKDLRELRIVLALIGTTEGLTESTRRILALILSPVAGSPGKWERIGLLKCPEEDEFSNAEVRKIEII